MAPLLHWPALKGGAEDLLLPLYQVRASVCAYVVIVMTAVQPLDLPTGAASCAASSR
jgi:hypothetical protein